MPTAVFAIEQVLVNHQSLYLAALRLPESRLGLSEVSECDRSLALDAWAGYRAAIEKLRADNAALKEELRLENKFSVQPTAANASALIQNLKKQSDVYTKKVAAALQPSPLDTPVV